MERRKWGRATWMWETLIGGLSHPPQGTKPTSQACALTGDWTSDTLLCRTMPNQPSHVGQGSVIRFLKNSIWFLCCGCAILCCLGEGFLPPALWFHLRGLFSLRVLGLCLSGFIKSLVLLGCAIQLYKEAPKSWFAALTARGGGWWLVKLEHQHRVT